jgi:hypothetical protein
MSEPSPYFYAWCDEADKVDAFSAAVSVLAAPGTKCGFMITNVMCGDYTVDQVIEEVRADFRREQSVYTSFYVMLPSGRGMRFSSHCFGAVFERTRPTGPLNMTPFNQGELLPARLEIALGGGERSVEVEAVIASLLAQPDVEDLLLRLCAPDASKRVPTGGCAEFWGWGAPIEIGATYHADAAQVARDLALSWVHLHDGDRVEGAAGTSLSALRERVEAAPHGARVAVKSSAELSREAVLAALDTSPSALLDALEASAAAPDDEWRTALPRALETLEAAKQGAPTYEADLTTRKHVRFLQQHAPYHVRRLPSGGVMLATHPYRTLWPLWADALYLLGITP